MNTKRVFLMAVSVGLLLPAGVVWGENASLTLPADTPVVRATTEPGGTAVFSCPDAQWLGRTGEPDIPWKVMMILLPPDVVMQTVAVRLDAGKFEPMQGQWTVAPVPPPASWQKVVWPADKTIVDGRDVDVYERDALWPEADIQLLTTGRLRKWRLAQVALPLLKYNPVSGALYKMTGGDVVVTFQQAPPPPPSPALQAELADRIGENSVRRMAVNFEQQREAYEQALVAAGDGATRGDGRGERGYVIITTSEIESSSNRLHDFVVHKESEGLDVQVITETDLGRATGDAAAEAIRSWLQAHYIGNNIRYVLLIGDPHPDTSAVPMKMLWPRKNATSWPEYPEGPSDYYYADLTGNWDLDADGFYGEWGQDFGAGGVDRIWDVLVGRIPYYGSISDLDSILQKMMDFQRAGTWPGHALLPMEPSDGSTPGYHLGEQIKTDILVPQGYSYYRVYDEDYGVGPELTPCNIPNVTSAWGNQPVVANFWWTHGSPTSAADVMDVAHVTSLNDAPPSFTFQASCYNAHPETTNNLAYELLRQGAIVTIAATRVSWYWSGQTQFAGQQSNAGMNYEYASRIVARKLSASEALHDEKQVLSPNCSEGWMNFVVFNLYGDPAAYVPVGGRIPAVSQWGLIVLTLLLLTAAKVAWRYRPARA